MHITLQDAWDKGIITDEQLRDIYHEFTEKQLNEGLNVSLPDNEGNYQCYVFYLQPGFDIPCRSSDNTNDNFTQSLT